MSKTKLLVASGNKKKLKELQALLEGLDVELISLSDFEKVPEIIEDGDTFRDNAVKKALGYAKWSSLLTIADDSGLCVDVLDGAPGVNSARFAGPEKDDNRNCSKLLGLLKDIPRGKRSAHFICNIALALPSEVIGVVEGRCDGEIASGMRGSNGFGYDPVFIDPDHNKTFAELSPETKNKISHRSRALKLARELIIKYLKAASNA